MQESPVTASTSVSWDNLLQKEGFTTEERNGILAILDGEGIILNKSLRQRTLQYLKLPLPEHRRLAFLGAVEKFQKELKDQTSNDEFTSWKVEQVCDWLRRNGWGECEASFRVAGVNGITLMLLTEEDLRQLGVTKMGTRIDIMEGLEKFHLSCPNALDNLAPVALAQLQERELLAVPFSNTGTFIKGSGWNTLKSEASDVPSPVISFFGPSGSGKSRLVLSLLSLTDRINHRIPLLATAGQEKSTTGNVSMFYGTLPKVNEEGSHPTLVLDLEGEDGVLPIGLKQTVKEFLVTKETSKFKLIFASFDRATSKSTF